MRLRGLASIAFVLLLLLPPASAGSERDPEIRDAPDLPNRTAADVVAVWYEAEEDGVRFSIQTVDGSRPVEFPDFVYWVYFEIESTGEAVGAAVGFANDGILRGFLSSGVDGGLNDPRIWNGGFERVANGGVVDLQQDRGRPSTWSGLIPWGAVDGLEDGATLSNLVAGSAHYDRRARQWEGGIDRASSDDVFVAEVPSFLSRMTAGVLPILVPAWVLPLIVLACTLAGAGGGYALARRPPPAAPPAPKSVPVRAAPPPPGERFRAAPPPRK